MSIKHPKYLKKDTSHLGKNGARQPLKHALSKEDQIWTLHRDGLGPTSIAVRLGLTRKAVIRVLNDGGATEIRQAGARTASMKSATDRAWQNRDIK